MTRVLFVSIFLFFTQAQSQIAFVQIDNNSSSGATTLVGSLTATAGNLLVGCIYSGNGSTISVADDDGNTWIEITNTTFQIGNRRCAMWYAQNVNGGVTNVTATFGSSTSCLFSLIEYSDIATTGALDKFSDSTGVITSAVGSGYTATTTHADELLVGMVAQGAESGSITPDASYTERADYQDPGFGRAMQVQDQIVSATATYQSTQTLPGNDYWGAIIGTFKGAVAAPGVTPGVKPKLAPRWW